MPTHIPSYKGRVSAMGKAGEEPMMKTAAKLRREMSVFENYDLG